MKYPEYVIVDYFTHKILRDLLKYESILVPMLKNCSVCAMYIPDKNVIIFNETYADTLKLRKRTHG